MADADPAATPTPTLAELFADYNPQGALNGTFAPAYVSGYAPSEQAVSAWAAQNRPITSANIEDTRLPTEYMGNVPKTAGDGVYGSGVPTRQSYLDPRGTVDPEALRVLAQGGHYDMATRRNAIAARLAANAAAAAPPPAPLLAAPQQTPFFGE